MSDFNITLFEACELLNRSKKSISRYIRRDLLHPERVKSQQGTLEYRFSKADIEAFKAQETLKAEQAEQTRPDGTERTDQTRHLEGSFIKNKAENDQSRQDIPAEETGQENKIITILKETAGLLRDQLKTKDKQIDDLGNKIDGLIERSRETNILIGQLQSKVFMLEQPKKEQIYDEADKTGQDTADKTEQDEEKPEKKEDKGIYEL